MNNSRRTFLKNSALAATGASLFPGSFFSGKRSDVTGLQLYSVRDDMKSDPMGTLQQLSKMGYQYVEHANYIDRKFYGYSAMEFKRVLDSLGLKMLSGHTVMGKQHWDESKNDFTDAWKYTVDDAATVGQRYVISPWFDEGLRKNYDDMLRFLQLFNKSGELCKKHGMKFGYHNHDFEFKYSLNGMKIYDIIMKNTDPALVVQQLDMGNMIGGGGKPMEVIKQYPGRFESLHVKDEIKSGKGEMGDGYESTVLGAGIINTKEITDLARKIGGSAYYIIEQESYQGKTPLDCAREDLAIMKKWGY